MVIFLPSFFFLRAIRSIITLFSEGNARRKNVAGDLVMEDIRRHLLSKKTRSEDDSCNPPHPMRMTGLGRT